MKAIILRETADGNILQIEQVEMPKIVEDEVLVKVKAISINPIDVKTKAGNGVHPSHAALAGIILGWDISGVVEDSRSPRFKAGDEVFGMINFPGSGNAYAEYVAAPAGHLALKPENVSHEDAAAATLAALTAFQAMVRHAQVKQGDHVLIHAASGGVGHFAVQIAKHLGATVTATSSSTNEGFVRELGADFHLDYNAGPFEEQVFGVDFVLDTMSGDYIDRSINIIKKGGTIVSIVKGLNETVADKAAAKGVNGLSMLVQSNGEDMQEIAGLLQKGIIKPHISKVFDFEDMYKAHEQLETGRTKGKVVVTH